MFLTESAGQNNLRIRIWTRYGIEFSWGIQLPAKQVIPCAPLHADKAPDGYKSLSKKIHFEIAIAIWIGLYTTLDLDPDLNPDFDPDFDFDSEGNALNTDTAGSIQEQ
jgi:hypothetical protein